MSMKDISEYTAEELRLAARNIELKRIQAELDEMTVEEFRKVTGRDKNPLPSEFDKLSDDDKVAAAHKMLYGDSKPFRER